MRVGTSLKNKLILASISLIITLLALEIIARLYMPQLAPVSVREGLYTNILPLVTSAGGPPIALKNLSRWGVKLKEEKKDGEIRIFILGESSVEGSPFDINASIAAMLLDRLRELLPGREITVVNMGRSSSVSANVYYYLLYVSRYSPDFIVFYMGMNDTVGMPGEQCMPLLHPHIHGVWRSLVEHSWLLWLTRTYGPQFLWLATDKRDWNPPTDCPMPTFDLWFDILVKTARAISPNVIVVNPVRSVAVEFEENREHPENLTKMSEQYRELLACELTEGCDYSAMLKEKLKLEKSKDEEIRREKHNYQVSARASAWKKAAMNYGAEHIELDRIFESASRHNILAEDFFADWLHLLPKGYLFIAHLVGERIRSMITGLPERAVEVPKKEDVKRYIEASTVSGVPIAFSQFRFGLALTVVPGLKFIVESFPKEICERKRFCNEIELAELALGWLRVQAGLDHGLRPELLEEFKEFDPLKDYFSKERMFGRN